MQLTTRGIILKETPFGDHDKILTILTPDKGVITAFANGARKFRGKLAPASELLCYSNIVFFYNRERYSVDHLDGIDFFVGLRASIEKLALASYFAEISLVLGPKVGDDGVFLRLLLNTLSFLEKDKRDFQTLKSLFELRALSISGFMPDLLSCFCCGEFTEGSAAFFYDEGTLCCENCLSGQNGRQIKLTAGALAAMRHIIYAPVEKLFSFQIAQNSKQILTEATEQYIISQTDHEFRTLSFYKQVAAL